jgi:hypothetical protein
LSKQKSLFLKSTTKERENLTASCEVRLELVEHEKSFRDRELRCAIKVANAFSDSRVAIRLKTVLLSHQTVSRKVSENVDNVSDTLHCVMNDCLGLDESTDIMDFCQLVIFVRIIDKNFEMKEEFLNLQSLTTDTTGSHTFEAINKVVSEFTSFEKCTDIFSDGAKSMVGSKTVLLGHLKQLGVNFVFLHCIIHQ